MDIPSSYQSAFFSALNKRDDVDLIVRYFRNTPDDRVLEGWNSLSNFNSYEQCVDDICDIKDVVNTVIDWRERIHIISINFNIKLVYYLCNNGVKWCHWSETPGIRLISLLNYNIGLYMITHPLMLLLKYEMRKLLKLYSVGVFAQGVLAQRAFMLMGVPSEKISHLYYAPSPLKKVQPCKRIREFSNGRKVFLCVGALSRRKGTDVLLKAMSRVPNDDWCLVICGHDKSDGVYRALINKLKLQDRVLLMGAHPADKIAEVYSASDVFILASRFDGWGVVLNEAASIGMPLISTKMCGAAWHVIVHEKNGFRVTAGSVNELASAMRKYVENHDLIEEHGVYSKIIYYDMLTPEQNADRMVMSLRMWHV